MTASILHFSTSDSEGGSARSARRIHDGLRGLGFGSRMLVSHKGTTGDDVDIVHGGRFGRLADRVMDEIWQRSGWQYLWYPSSRRILAHPWLDQADIVQLFNTHGGYLSPLTVAAMAKRLPVVWRMSDMWMATGHCAYAGSCTRWRDGCGKCPDLDSYPPIARDNAARLWRMKRRLWESSDITIVAPSSWAENVARQSPLLAGKPVHRIANGIDTNLFRPLPREIAHTVLGLDLPPSAITILFSAHVAGDNPRKGTSLLREALRTLGPSDDLVLLVAGLGGEAWRGQVPQRVEPLGYVRDQRMLAVLNAAADMVVTPSVAENLPNTILEAMGGGRPVVAFDAGGIRDAIVHGQTGLLVPEGDPDALAKALHQLAANSDLRLKLGGQAREAACRDYAQEIEARRFAELYQSILAERKG